MNQKSRIHFSNTPLNEVVIGVSFSGIQLKIEHFGEYFRRDKKFSSTSIQHPLASVGIDSSNFKLLDRPELPRVWFEFQDPSFLIQLQHNRFILNWRKTGGSSYPHFNGLMEMFLTEWGSFCSFCNEQRLGKATIEFFEVTYINQIAQSHGYGSQSDLPKLLKNLNFPVLEGALTAVGLDLVSEVEGLPLIQSYKPVQSVTGEPAFIFELASRGKFQDSRDLRLVLESANTLLTSQFVKLTTNQAHISWGLKQ